MHIYTKELLQQQYKDGIISYKVLFYFDIAEKVKSLQEMPNGDKVRVVSSALGTSRDTIYRALRMFGK